LANVAGFAFYQDAVLFLVFAFSRNFVTWFVKPVYNVFLFAGITLDWEIDVFS